jgi:hypothetical protein
LLFVLIFFADNDFKARAVSSLDRLDVFLVRNGQDLSAERCRQQIRFDTDRILAAVRDQVPMLPKVTNICNLCSPFYSFVIF